MVALLTGTIADMINMPLFRRRDQRSRGRFRNRLRISWEFVRTSIWPVPVAMLVLAVALREAAALIDARVDNEVALSLWWLHSGSGDDARNLLSTLVGALITMASVMFSITMVVLSLAANQFGSRLIRTYMADTRTKVSLGWFVLTIVYCLLILRTVYTDLPPEEVPHVAVTLGLALALVCVLTLLLFLHVIARSMVADDVIRRVAGELAASLAQLPKRDSETRPLAAPLEHDGPVQIVRTGREGYVQTIDYEALCAVACDRSIKVQIHCKAGAFVCPGDWLAEVSPASAMGSSLAAAIERSVEIGARRTPTQDIEFLVRHLVDVALRALSPGINDPRTATVVIDHLRATLARLMTREIRSTRRCGPDGTVRVQGIDTTFAALLDEAFNQIRQVGAAQPAIVIHLLGAIDRLAEHIQIPEQKAPLTEHLTLIAEAGLRKADAPRDRADIERKRDAALRKIATALSLDGLNKGERLDATDE
jgi:uncharacterized membrane protein